MADWALNPPDGEIIAQVWGCGTECECTEARIFHVLGRNRNGYIINTRDLWTGDFVSGGEGQAYRQLSREASRVRNVNPDLFARIIWQDLDD